LDHAKRDRRRRRRLEKENVDEKICRHAKIEKVVVVSGSLGLQKTELQDLGIGIQLGVVAGNKACKLKAEYRVT